MKAHELKLWETFYNNNGYMCIVYKITGTKVHIINYNGSIYSVSLNGNANYKHCGYSALYFFENYPMHILRMPEEKAAFQQIRKLWRYGEINTRLKLLLL